VVTQDEQDQGSGGGLGSGEPLEDSGRPVADENRSGEDGAGTGGGSPEGQGDGLRDAWPGPLNEFPKQTPLFHATQADRYARQEQIRTYESAFGCRFVVMSDVIFPDSVTLFEELVFDADPGQDLHLILNSPGGDGETAIRIARQAQSRCRS